ncbi:hypothetical protein LS73_001020 [Helicobacter muridarum]|uniref:Peptidoglycan-associated lipoprotein n=1 Tax=Helicobacter muridarum TaxID=216 RepID=A0A099TYY1_9HELI|nr:OmpA family protein [Helicobacter muridarum]TLE01298.1 hypothetical protein LS73_001020 [Helicobacter muridarum]STQ87166.1 peptidoglycan-associated lipoprotein [Helicobacter muridarum]
MKYLMLSGILLSLFLTVGCGSKSVDSSGGGGRQITQQDSDGEVADESEKMAQNDGGFMPVPGPDSQGLSGVEVIDPKDVTRNVDNGEKDAYTDNKESNIYGDDDYAQVVPADSLYTIYFDFDRYNIRNNMKPYIKADAEYIREKNIKSIVLQGNTDELGTDEYNFALGQKRALSVRDALVLQGIPKDIFSTVSFGSSKPVCREKTEQCHAKNRRTEVIEK